MDETCYQTEAEEYGWSFVFGGLLPDDFPLTRARRYRVAARQGNTPDSSAGNLGFRCARAEPVRY